MFLRRNGRHLETTNAELERFTLWVVEARPLLNEIADWFRVHIVPVD
jgi:prophage maintenance system killer protein